MTRIQIRLLAIVSASLLLVIAPSTGTTAVAQAIDVFLISYGDTVADGVPGPGAGNLEAGGAEDRYEFDGEAGDVAVLDVLAGSTTTFRWRLDAPRAVASGAAEFGVDLSE